MNTLKNQGRKRAREFIMRSENWTESITEENESVYDYSYLIPVLRSYMFDGEREDEQDELRQRERMTAVITFSVASLLVMNLLPRQAI